MCVQFSFYSWIFNFWLNYWDLTLSHTNWGPSVSYKKSFMSPNINSHFSMCTVTPSSKIFNLQICKASVFSSVIFFFLTFCCPQNSYLVNMLLTNNNSLFLGSANNCCSIKLSFHCYWWLDFGWSVSSFLDSYLKTWNAVFAK